MKQMLGITMKCNIKLFHKNNAWKMNKKQRVEGTEGRSGRIEGNTILVGDAER